MSIEPLRGSQFHLQVVGFFNHLSLTRLGHFFRNRFVLAVIQACPFGGVTAYLLAISTITFSRSALF